MMQFVTGNTVFARRMTFFFLVMTLAASAQQKPPRPFELRAKSSKFWKVISSKEKLDTIAQGFEFTEGPAWDKRGFVYVSDERGNKIYKIFPDGKKELFLEMGDPDGSTFDRHGRLINCASVPRAVLAIEPDGKSKVIADHFEGKRLNTPNDVVTGPDGALYFTDPTLDLPKTEKQELPFQGVYRLGDDGTLRLLIKDLVQPNGLAFSPDGKRLYVDDSRTRNIHVYDVSRTLEISNGRVFGVEQGPPGSGGCDGMRVDTKGNLFATGPEGIWIWSPEGEQLGTVVLPKSAANLAWGDADFKTLYITAQDSVYRLRTKTKGFDPNAKFTRAARKQ